MKSMKQIADELNVTKMTVYNNAKKLNVKFQKFDNVNYLSKEDESIVVKRIRKNQNKYDDFENKRKDSSNNNNLVKNETIKHLYNQLEIYKEQANRDKEQINTLNRLLENQQILALESNKKIKKLENELEQEKQLNSPFDKFSNDRQNVDKREVTYTEDKINEENIKGFSKSKEDEEYEKSRNNREERTKGFWSRLLKK